LPALNAQAIKPACLGQGFHFKRGHLTLARDGFDGQKLVLFAVLKGARVYFHGDAIHYFG
jgi:hypothetical protein